jgi:hypothetical protein
MGDVFIGYQNLFNGTSNVVVHEWVFDLNISLENLNFQIVSISIMIHYSCLETFVYVPMTRAIFQHTINNVQKHCPKTTTKVNDKLEKCFPTYWDVMDALRSIYPQY